MTGATLQARLRAFDEAALVTLANAGLYRRAVRDLAEGKAVLVELGPAEAVVEADGQRVEIDARGPQAARCACKAPGICRHRLVAVLLLQQQGDALGDAGGETASNDGAAAGADEAAGLDEAAKPDAAAEAAVAAPPVVALDPVALLGEIRPAAIERWTGKAAWRAAREIAAQPATVAVEAQAIVVRFDDAEPVRILRGQGLDGIVSKASAGRRKPLHAAALIAARRHFGLALPDQAGREAAPAAESAAPLDAAPPDPAFLAQVAAALDECAAFAFNLAPLPLEERLFTLSVSSRADALPRLGRLMRTLAAQLRLKRRRAFTYDPDMALETLATAHALVQALGRVDAAGDPARRLLLHGTHRQTYPPSEPVLLVGCGAEQWRTEAGARGVTGIFHDAAGDRWLTYAHARGPGQDPLFDPRGAFDGAAIWTGATLRDLVQARFRLEGVGISIDGRLSNPQGARATVIADAARSTGDWASRLDDWDALERRLAERFGFGLARRTAPDFVLLAPQRFARPFFDDLAQTLIWPIEDVAGRWLGLALPHEEGPDRAIARIEQLAQRGWHGQLVARVSQAGARIALAPVALDDDGRWINLSVDREAGRPSQPLRWSELWVRLDPMRRGAGGSFRPAPSGATEAALASSWQQLIDLGECGPARARPALLSTVAGLAEQCDRLGQPTVARRLAAVAQDPPAHFLGAAYAVSLARSQRIALPRLFWHR